MLTYLRKQAVALKDIVIGTAGYLLYKKEIDALYRQTAKTFEESRIKFEEMHETLNQLEHNLEHGFERDFDDSIDKRF